MSSLLSDPERTHVREALGITGRLRASQAGCGRTQNPWLSTPSCTLNLPRKSGQKAKARKMPDLSPATIQHGVHRSSPVGTKSQAVQASQRSFNDMLLRGQRVVPAPKLEVQMICNLGRSWEEGCFAKPSPGVRDRDTYEIDGSRSEQDLNPCLQSATR